MGYGNNFGAVPEHYMIQVGGGVKHTVHPRYYQQHRMQKKKKMGGRDNSFNNRGSYSSVK